VSSRNAAFHDGALAGVLLSPLKLAFSLVLGLAALLLCAWILDWTFVFKVWPQGIGRLRELLAHDLERGVALAARQGAGAGPITWPANALYSIVFEATGIHDMGVQFANGAALSIPDTVMRRSYVSHRESIEAAMVGNEIVGRGTGSRPGAALHRSARKRSQGRLTPLRAIARTVAPACAQPVTGTHWLDR
jgi:hypothetical protein